MWSSLFNVDKYGISLVLLVLVVDFWDGGVPSPECCPFVCSWWGRAPSTWSGGARPVCRRPDKPTSKGPAGYIHLEDIWLLKEQSNVIPHLLTVVLGGVVCLDWLFGWLIAILMVNVFSTVIQPCNGKVIIQNTGYIITAHDALRV